MFLLKNYYLTILIIISIIYVSDLYSEILPNDAPPSYKGHLVKYAYKITVGMQRLNSPIKLLRVPIRVVVIHGNL